AGHLQMRDAAGNLSPTRGTPADDKVSPLPPTLTLVDGKGAFTDGKWYTNSLSATVTVSGVRSGYLVTVGKEANGQPGFQPNGGDPTLCQVTATGTTASCNVSTLAPDGLKQLWITSVDNHGNASSAPAASFP